MERVFSYPCRAMLDQKTIVGRGSDHNDHGQKHEFALVVIPMLLLIAGWSIASIDYTIQEGDARWQAPMVLHAANPLLLNRDPLITEVATQYTSIFFPVVAWSTRVISLPAAYSVFYIVTRVLLIFAYYHLAYVCTFNRLTALVATGMLTGIGWRHLATYLGGVSLVEATLVPRSMALPFALMAVAGMIQERHISTTLWLLLAFAIHPVTGVNAIGVYIIHGVLSHQSRAWRPFLLSIVFILIIVGTYILSAGHARYSSLFLGDEWRQIVFQTVGDFTFLKPGILSKKFWTLVFAGLLSILVTRSWRLAGIYSRFAAAAILAIGLHFVGVDLYGVVPLLEMCPERATFALTAVSGIGLGVLSTGLWVVPSWRHRLLAGALFLSLFLRLPIALIGTSFCSCVVALILKDCTFRIRKQHAWAYASLAFVLGLLLVFAFPALGRSVAAKAQAVGPRGVLAAVMFRSPNEGGMPLSGFQNLGRLGITDQDAMDAQLWIKANSSIAETIFPPAGIAPGWQIFSERPYVFTGSLFTYTYLSSDFALRYRDFMNRRPSGEDVSWSDMLRFATEEGADLVVIDSRQSRHRKGDPPPMFSAGPYRIFRLGKAEGGRFPLSGAGF